MKMKTLIWLLAFLPCVVEGDLTFKKNSTVTLPCSADKIDPLVLFIEWVRLADDGTEERLATVMKTQGPWVADKDRWQVDKNTYELTLFEASVSDTGLFKCKGSISNGTDVYEAFSNPLRVTITDVPSKPPGKPDVTALGFSSIAVSWQFSLNDNNSPIKLYSIRIRQMGGKAWTDARQENVPEHTNQTEIYKLLPYTGYQVAVLAYNQDGYSVQGDPSDTVYTHQALPTSKPKIDENSIVITNTSIKINFRPPKFGINGVMVGYRFKHRAVSVKDWRMSQSDNPNTTIHTFMNLKPFTHYLIQILISNEIGQGPPVSRVLQTDEGVPSGPDIYDVRNKTHHSVTVFWYPPHEMNGQLTGYKIYWTRNGITLFSIIDKDFDRKSMNYTVEYLETKIQYQFQVAALTKKGVGEKSNTYIAYTDCIGPNAPAVHNITWDSSSSFVIFWNTPSEVCYQVDYYVIRYKPSGSEYFETKQYSGERNGATIHKARISDLDPNSVYYVQVAGATKSLFYDNFHIGKYSNLTKTWCSNEALCVAEETVKSELKKGKNTGTIAGVLLGIAVTLIILVAALALFLLRRKYGPFQYWFVSASDRSYTAAPPILTSLPESQYQAEHDAVEIEKWNDHVEGLHADADIGFSQEFDAINQNIGPFSAHAAIEPENKLKNRYINIVAYDDTRVYLKNPGNRVKNGDYINANFVDGYNKPNAYIAAQGPLPSTFPDFWRMVWEQGSEVIVMITNLIERGKRKCDQYWPNEGEQQYGQLSVKWLKTWTTAHYTIRKFILRNTKIKKKSLAEREVLQFHFTDWPDHGVPNYHLPVLDFVYKSAEASHQMAGPPIIHCSAGVGRTGTYIVLDTMIRQIEDQASVNVYQFLQHIRSQRNFLVQTEDQYIFIHDALAEYISSNGKTEVKKSEISKYLKELQLGENLDKLFQRITAHKPHDYEHTSAILPINIEKNRSKEIMPVILSRVKLPMRPGVEGSDYINASYLQGYNHIEEYIVTQHPLSNTASDFWRMVWDQNTMTVVLLSQLDEQEYQKFWPEKGQAEDYGNFKLTFSEETHELNHITRDFLLESTQDDYECTVRIIATSYWPESCTPINQAFEFLHTVRNWHENNEQMLEGPIVVLDRFGGVEAGIFCALYTMYDQLIHRQAIDVYMVTKLYHLKRPGIFEKKEDILFLMKAIQSIASDIKESADEYFLQNHIQQSSTVPKLSSRSFRDTDRDDSTM